MLNDRFRSVPQSNTATGEPDPPGVFFLAAKRPDANGTAVGTFGAATDTGLLYQVQTVGNQQEWVEISTAPTLSYHSAIATGSLTLVATTYNDVPGATFAVAAGTWVVLAISNFAVSGAGDAGAILTCGLSVAGVLQTALAIYTGPAGATATVSQIWVLSGVGAGNILKLRGNKQAGATGASGIVVGHTKLFALRLGS